MRLSFACLALCLCGLSAAPAFAADDDGLDLALPRQPMFEAGATTPYRNDPPGTYYGDTSGVPASAADAQRRPACPTAPDGSERALTGSFTTGIGYSSRGGNSSYNAARLNYCKSYVDDDGDERTINVDVHVGRVDGGGFGGDGPHGGWRGPPPGR